MANNSMKFSFWMSPKFLEAVDLETAIANSDLDVIHKKLLLPEQCKLVSVRKTGAEPFDDDYFVVFEIAGISSGDQPIPVKPLYRSADGKLIFIDFTVYMNFNG